MPRTPTIRSLTIFTLLVLVTGCRLPFEDLETDLIGDWILVERGSSCQQSISPFDCLYYSPPHPTAPEIQISIRKNGCIQEIVGGDRRDVDRITSVDVTGRNSVLNEIRLKIEMKTRENSCTFWLANDTLRSFQLPEFLDETALPIEEKPLGVFVRK